jgi:hypothetical protein
VMFSRPIEPALTTSGFRASNHGSYTGLKYSTVLMRVIIAVSESSRLRPCDGMTAFLAVAGIKVLPLAEVRYCVPKGSVR